MKHLILGTAGHVDHGKTSLIRALTGFDCDTHIEEQDRGITIHLGFTHIAFDSERQVGIIDVPGHKDFVNTMIAGASGIDFVMLVIAADSGIMPQTIEHLKIMQLLKIKSGFVALTKIDLVDSELLELAISEIEEFTTGTFLEDCPIISVSNKSGEGLTEIKHEIIRQIEKTAERDLGVIFRMYIDRIFTSEGYGTIVNGSVLSGKLSKDANIQVLPGKKTLRIRGMQKFHQEVEQVKAGDRASLNIVGMKRDEFKRGMLITNYDRENTSMIDCTLENFSNKELKLWSTAIFLSGTFKSKAKIHLIDCDKLEANNKAIIQITLDVPGVFYYNDKFILRDTSNNYTIGGGSVIDAFPLKHRKRPQELIKKLHLLALEDLNLVLLNEIEKSIDIINSEELSYKLNISKEKVEYILNTQEDKVAIIKQDNFYIYILHSYLGKIHNEIIKIVKRYLINNSLSCRGLTISDIAKYLTLSKETLTKNSLLIILTNMVESGNLKKIQDTYVIPEHNPRANAILLSLKDAIIQQIDSYAYDIPEDTNKEQLKLKYSLKNQEITSILNALEEENRIIYYDNNYLSLSNLKQLHLLMKEKFGKQEFRIAEFRDMLSANRKIALYFLELFDKLGITQRNDDFRVLTNKELK